MKREKKENDESVGMDLTIESGEINLDDNPRLNVSVLEEQLKESNEKYLRLAAEFENFKKRTIKEKEDLVSNTKVKMIQSILDMDNDLNFALKNSEVSEGMKLILNKLQSFLKSQGIEEIQTENYDEDLHEVISVIESDKSGIVDVVSKGYTLNGQPFRYPKIILAKDNA
jgi:molecular chaperone GrpE